MNADQLDLLSLCRDARDEGIAQVEAASDDWMRATVDQAIKAVADRGLPFSANDVRGLLPLGIRPALMGARFRYAATSGLVQRIGYVPSTDPGTHAHPVAQWLRVATVEQDTESAA